MDSDQKSKINYILAIFILLILCGILYILFSIIINNSQVHNIFIITKQENTHITPAELSTVSNKFIGNKDIDINDVKEAFEEVPWIAQADVQKTSYSKDEYNKKFGTHEDFIFPKSVLEVNITERTPVAYWKLSHPGYFIDKNEHIFKKIIPPDPNYLVDKNGHIFKGVLNANDPPIFITFVGIQESTCINDLLAKQNKQQDNEKDNPKKQIPKNCILVDNAKNILSVYKTAQKDIEGLRLGNDTLRIRQVAQDIVGVWRIWVWAFDSQNNYDPQKSFVINLGTVNDPTNKLDYFSKDIWNRIPKDKPFSTISLSYNNNNFAICNNENCRIMKR